MYTPNNCTKTISTNIYSFFIDIFIKKYKCMFKYIMDFTYVISCICFDMSKYQWQLPGVATTQKTIVKNYIRVFITLLT